MRSFPDPPAFTQPIPADPASIARGEHLARTRGCAGCHGPRLEGQVFHDGNWFSGRAVAPNLARLAREVPPATLEAAIRRGIGRDGRALYTMPSYNFITMTDADVAALIAYLRSAPVADQPLPRPILGVRVRWALATGSDWAIPHFLGRVPQLAWQSHADPAVRRGEYLAMTSCNECHGFGLRGDDPWAPAVGGPPDLAIVGGYGRADFVRLMRTGKAVGNRELGLMSQVARGRFVHWSDREVEDLYAFLTAMAAGPPPP